MELKQLLMQLLVHKPNLIDNNLDCIKNITIFQEQASKKRNYSELL